MSKLRSDRSLVAVLATARSRQELHASLLQCRGGHIFDKVLEITPPSLVSDVSLCVRVCVCVCVVRACVRACMRACVCDSI